MTDFAWLTVAEVSALLRSKKLSPVEYAKALIARAEKHDKHYNAYLRPTPDIALEDARRAENEILQDLPTTAHSKILQNNVATADAVVTQKLKAAGGVFMGKLSTHEFATGGPSFDLPWPPARNPWNRDHFCGGSSSGSGTATGAGFLPAAIGTDTGGSVRNPASMCGVVGMKGTYGLVSRRGVVPLAFSLDHVGTLTRTVRDNAMMLDLIAGYDAQDPASANHATGGYTAQLGRDLKGLRIGVLRHFYAKDMQADAEVAASIEASVQKLTELGAIISEVSTAPLQTYQACNRVILLSEAFAVHEKWMQERPQDYGQLARERLMGGAFVRAADYVNATRLRRKLTAEFHALFDHVDVIVTSSSMDPPCRIDDPQANEYTYSRQSRAPFNVTGSPGLSVPTGFTKNGLPLGIQLVGKPFSEALLYRVAYAYEQASPWVNMHPTLV